jgi:hypothetical protein
MNSYCVFSYKCTFYLIVIHMHDPGKGPNMSRSHQPLIKTNVDTVVSILFSFRTDVVQTDLNTLGRRLTTGCTYDHKNNNKYINNKPACATEDTRNS